MSSSCSIQFNGVGVDWVLIQSLEDGVSNCGEVVAGKGGEVLGVDVGEGGVGTLLGESLEYCVCGCWAYNGEVAGLHSLDQLVAVGGYWLEGGLVGCYLFEGSAAIVGCQGADYQKTRNHEEGDGQDAVETPHDVEHVPAWKPFGTIDEEYCDEADQSHQGEERQEGVYPYLSVVNVIIGLNRWKSTVWIASAS